MARCRECRAHNVKISGTASRKSFAIRCLNPRCRSTYVQTLGISGDLIAVFRGMQNRRSVARRFREAAGHPFEWNDSD